MQPSEHFCLFHICVILELLHFEYQNMHSTIKVRTFFEKEFQYCWSDGQIHDSRDKNWNEQLLKSQISFFFYDLTP